MMVISIPCVFLVVVFEGFSMLCFLLITFISDLEIDGMLVDHFFLLTVERERDVLFIRALKKIP